MLYCLLLSVKGDHADCMYFVEFGKVRITVLKGVSCFIVESC